ncbi:MAG: hypothetical protein ACI8ZM_004585 [Crocinitomix sp.]|jgi:hypothetical protein
MKEITVIYVITLTVNIIFPFVFLDWDISDKEGGLVHYIWLTIVVQLFVILFSFIGKKLGFLKFLQTCTLVMSIINFLGLVFIFILLDDFKGDLAHQYVLFMLLQLATFALSLYHTKQKQF